MTAVTAKRPAEQVKPGDASSSGSEMAGDTKPPTPDRTARFRVKELNRFFNSLFGPELSPDEFGLRCTEIMLCHLAQAGGEVSRRMDHFLDLRCPGMLPELREELKQVASISNRRWSADELGAALNLTMAMRTALAITTIGAIDCDREARQALRKAKQRKRSEDNRRRQRLAPKHKTSAEDKRLAVIIRLLPTAGWVSVAVLSQELARLPEFGRVNARSVSRLARRCIATGAKAGRLQTRYREQEQGAHGMPELEVARQIAGVPGAGQVAVCSQRSQAANASLSAGHGRTESRLQPNFQGANPNLSARTKPRLQQSSFIDANGSTTPGSAMRGGGAGPAASGPGRDLVSADIATPAIDATSLTFAAASGPGAQAPAPDHQPHQVNRMDTPTNEAEFRAYFTAELAKITTASGVTAWFNSTEEKALRHACGMARRPQLDELLQAAYARQNYLRAAVVSQ